MEPLSVLANPHQADGSGYYRFWLPFEYLARFSGHEVYIPDPGMKIAPSDEEIAGFDVVVGQRFMNDPGVRLTRRWSPLTHLVYECDDDLFHPDTASGLAHLFDAHTQQTILDCLGNCELVTVSTEPLAEEFRRVHGNVKVVPNYIHADVLYIDRPRAERPTVGWAGGMSHLQDWMEAASAVGAVLGDHPGWDMHFMGIDYSPLMKLPKTRYTPWNPHVWQYWRTIDFDIGLAPLADTQWNRCKSHIRALEYAALGIPVIASDCDPYRGMVVDGVTGYLVNGEDEWAARLTELIDDEAQRVEMGAKAREVAAGWTIQQGWKTLCDAYEEVAGWR